MKLSRTTCVRVKACDAPKPAAAAPPSLRKKVEAERAPVLKENLNKLASIASVDVKFLQDLVKELDVKHKEWFDEQKKKNNKKTQSNDNDNDEDINIFIEK